MKFKTHIFKFITLSSFLKIILFIFGCAGSSLLRGLFSSCGEEGLLSSCGVQVSRCSGFSCAHILVVEHGL